MPATIQCQHCAATVPSKRPAQQKWCPRCRVLKGVLAMGTGRAVPCMGCGARYHRTTRSERLCPSCAALVAVAPPLQQPCAVCGTHGPTLKGLETDALALCSSCVASPEEATHAKVMRAVAAKLRELLPS